MSADDNKAILLASIPPIVSSIMKYMSAKQLNACSQVSVLWRDIALTEKKRRKQICWFFVANCDVKGAHKLPCCTFQGQKSCLSPFCENVNDLPIEPALALILCTKSMVNHPEAFTSLGSRNLKRKFDSDEPNNGLDQATLRHPVIGSLLPHFPLRCEIGFCTALGVTGTTSDKSMTREIEFCPALTSIFFPRMPGVDIHRFMVSGFGFDVNNSTKFTELTGIPSDQPIKCLLVFLYDRVGAYRTLPFNKIIRHYVEGQNWEIALGGAYVNHMFFPRHKARRRNQSYGIAFTGENVRAASVLIKPEVENQEEVAEKLKIFGKSDLLIGQCIAFMFTCVARGYGLFNASDVESSIFRSMYPSVPLFGVFGQGEIGINYVPNLLKSKGILYSWFRNYTTVFVLLSIKN